MAAGDREVHPTALVLHDASRELEVRWEDGVTSRYAYGWLRSQCRCSACTAHRRSRGEAIPAPATVSVLAAEPQGNYAVRFVFDDGHDRGIYPWTYLRELGA